MDWKKETKLKFAEHLVALLEEYSKKHGHKKPSLRKLAARAGMEPSHVQRISTGEVDLALTTIVALAQGLDLPPSELLNF